MSESNKCRVCGEPQPEGFCAQCEWDRAAECVLFEKSDRGTLTAGELPVGALFRWRGFTGLVADLGIKLVRFRAEGASLDEFVSMTERVELLSLPKPDPASTEPAFAAPPDSELPTYDEVMGALWERWTVCDSVWTHVVPMTVRNWKGNVLEYPGPWFHLRSDGLPYLNLQRDDGQRVRFEVPGDWTKSDTLRFLKSVARDYRGTIPHSPYCRHVRWLPMAESQAKALPAKVDKLEAAIGQCDHEWLTTFGNTKGLPPHITMKDIVETAELVKKCAPLVSEDRPEMTWVCPWNPMSLTTKALSDAADRLRPRSDFDDMLRVTVKRKLDARGAEILGNWLGERVMLGVDLAADEDVGGVSVVYECAPCRTCKKHHAGPSGQCLGCRWRNVPADQVPHLERLLAEQVASGGTDCDASRSLLVRRERLIAEEQERAEHLEERRAAYRLQRSRFLENIADDCRSPRRGIRDDMPKPLIAYKRRGR